MLDRRQFLKTATWALQLLFIFCLVDAFENEINDRSGIPGAEHDSDCAACR